MTAEIRELLSNKLRANYGLSESQKDDKSDRVVAAIRANLLEELLGSEVILAPAKALSAIKRLDDIEQ